jgi:hypothetical protein
MHLAGHASGLSYRLDEYVLTVKKLVMRGAEFFFVGSGAVKGFFGSDDVLSRARKRKRKRDDPSLEPG